MPADRNLLFGILALQMDFVSKNSLIQAMNAWILQKQKSLGQILEEQGALQADARALLEPLVAKHLQMHGNDAQKSLASLGSVSSLLQDLRQIPDQDVEASLAPLAEITQNYEGPTAPNFGNRFRILRPHAKGGLGEVFVANDQELNREVALKEIQAQYAFKPEHRSRFLLEAEITGGLEHPGIVPVYGLGSYPDGRPFYAMRFIKGDSLKDAIKRFHDKDKAKRDPRERSLALRELLGRFVDVCQAIAYAHSRGVLHRDLKPGNVMLGKYGETLVVDWGLAKATRNAAGARIGAQIPAPETVAPDAEPGAESVSEPNPSSTPSAEHLLVLRSSAGPDAFTQMGQVIGTPAYMSPEQATGRLDELGPASDVYSLGATLYHLLTGVPSVVGEDMGEVLRRVQHGEIPSPRTIVPGVPAALDAVCRRAMALKSINRYASAQELAAEIERWLADEPVLAYREPISVRTQRWLGKHRTVASAAAVGVLMAFAALAVVLVLTKAGEEREKSLRKQEQTAKDEAIETRQDAVIKEKEARGYLYAAHMHLAAQAWEIADIRRVQEILDIYRNPGSKAEDLRGWEWYYHDRLCEGDLATLKGHSRGIRCVAFSPDNTRIVSASQDKTLKLWDPASGKELRTLNGHTEGVTSVAFSPDGSKLVSTSYDNTIRLWDAARGQEVRIIARSGRDEKSATFSPDGSKIASAGNERTVTIRDITSGKVLLNLKGHTGGVTKVVFSRDGAKIASASYDHTVRIWDAANGQLLHILKGHSTEVESVAFSPDGIKIASASGDNTLKVWDAANGKELQTLLGHSDTVNCVDYSPDGSTIASASDDNTLRLWDAASGDLLRTVKGHKSNVQSVAFSPDGSRMASGSYDNTIKLWNAGSERELWTVMMHSDSVERLSISPDGSRLVSSQVSPSSKCTEKLWDMSSGQEVATLKGKFLDTPGLNLAFSPDGARLTTVSGDERIRLWDSSTGRELRSLKWKSAGMSRLTLSPNGSILASTSENNTVKLWDATTGLEVGTLNGHLAAEPFVRFSPDGSRIASVSDKTVTLSNATTGQEIRTFICPSGAIFVTFSPNGSMLASANKDDTVMLWNLASGKEICTLKGHLTKIIDIVFSPNGATIASLDADNAMKLWEAANGKELHTLKGHSMGYWSATFSPEGSRLVSASYDKTIKLWDTESGQELCTLKGHSDRVTFAEFSPEGARIVSASADGTVKIWDAAPLTPALRTEREARALVDFHLARASSKNELLNKLHAVLGRSDAVRNRAIDLADEYWRRKVQILATVYVENLFSRAFPRVEVVETTRKDAKLDVDVRNAALALADDYLEDYSILADAAWDVAIKQGEKPEAYRRAVAQAEAAVRLEPQAYTLNVLGMAHYRNGEYQQALEKLELSGKLDANIRSYAPNMAFLAMTFHRLNQNEEAQRMLRDLGEMMKRKQWSSNEEARGLLKEAETLLATPHVPAKK